MDMPALQPHRTLKLKAPMANNLSSKLKHSSLASEDQPNTQGGASSSGADLEDVRDDWYDEDGNLMDEDEVVQDSEGGDTSETQRAFDNAAQNLSSRHYGRNPIYVEIPNKVDT